MEVDLEFSIGKVFNLKIFALVFVVIVCWDEGVVIVSSSLPCGVLGRTAGGCQNYWCRTLFELKKCHNSSIRQGRSPEKITTTKVTAQKSKQQCNCSVLMINV